MAYRQQPSESYVRFIRCHRHESAEASGSCQRCMQPICDPCIVYVGASTHCPACAKTVRRRRAIGRVVRATLVVGAIAGFAIYLWTRPPQFDYGAHDGEVRLARAKVDRERCDRRATIELEEALLGAGDNRGALTDVDAFVKKCGDWYRVHWIAYTAHHRMSEAHAAIDEATKLIDHDPSDKDYRWWRGVLYEEIARDDDAIADYAKAIELEPALTNIPFNLATLLERKGRPCEAKRVIEQFLDHHPGATDDAVLARLARLADACAAKSSSHRPHEEEAR